LVRLGVIFRFTILDLFITIYYYISFINWFCILISDCSPLYLEEEEVDSVVGVGFIMFRFNCIN